ncbi:MAG: GDP-mannose mannosyl hydrolase [Bacteroidales bacterium]|nr:GDP-mannose mannosyl hydrolase [Bacteroidales bacterium]
MLDYSTFKTVVKNTPLISIDLIVYNALHKILLGWRVNSPARDTWFVPGGRINKNETVAQAFSRITAAELGKEFHISAAQFMGVYEHIYPKENFTGSNDFDTHYIVLGFRIDLTENLNNLPPQQHKNYKWADVKEILNDCDVHQNVKNYFNGHIHL